jgi:hypothetical protein
MIEVVADIVGDVGDASSLPAAPERNMTAPVEPWYSCSTVRFCECISTAHRSRAAAGERAPPRARGRCMRRERTCVLVGLQALRRGWPPPDALAHGPRPTRYCRQAAPPHQAQAASWQAQLSCDWACEPLHEIHWASRTGFLPANTNNIGFLLVAAIGRVGRVGLVGDSLRSSVAPGGRQRQQLWPTAWCGRPLCARAGVQCHPEKRGLVAQRTAARGTCARSGGVGAWNAIALFCSMRPIALSARPVLSPLAPSHACPRLLTSSAHACSRLRLQKEKSAAITSLLSDITLLRGLFYDALRKSVEEKVTTPPICLPPRPAPHARASRRSVPCRAQRVELQRLAHGSE